MSTVKEEFEFTDKSGEHSITSNHILCCADTGRVVAVFYNERDLMAATGLVKKVELLDGKAYQFDYTQGVKVINDMTGICILNADIFLTASGSFCIPNCTNIQLLEVTS